MAWSRVPVSAVGKVQCGATVGSKLHGIRRVAACWTLKVPSRPSWKARSLVEPASGVKGIESLLASRGPCPGCHPRSSRTVSARCGDRSYAALRHVGAEADDVGVPVEVGGLPDEA